MHINELVGYEPLRPISDRYVISPKGTFGSGKSSIPHRFVSMSNYDEETIQVYWPEEFPKRRRLLPVATFMPELNLVMLGRYTHTCGGCDAILPVDIRKIMHQLWQSPFHILYEGVIVTHTKTTYVNFHTKLNELYPDRVRTGLWPFLYVHPLVAMQRVMGRESKRSAVQGLKILKIVEKHNALISWFDYYSSLDNNEAIWINTHHGMQYVAHKIAVLFGEEDEYLRLRRKDD
jgi:hypothetical protein